MNNVVKPYSNYFDSYKETYDEGNLNEKEGRNPWNRNLKFEITSVGDNELTELLESKNDFNEAKKLINDIRIDMSNVKIDYEDRTFLMIWIDW